jgi:hypothetical protein
MVQCGSEHGTGTKGQLMIQRTTYVYRLFGLIPIYRKTTLTRIHW